MSEDKFNKSKKDKKPLLFSGAAHVLVLCAILLTLTPPQFRAPPASAPADVIHASAIIEASADKDLSPKLQPKPTPEPVVDTPKEPDTTQQQKMMAEKADAAKAAAKEKMLLIESEKAKIQAQKEADLKKKKADAQKKLLAEKKALAQKEAQLKKQQLIADKKALDAERKKKLLTEQKKLQQQLMQQQINSEMKNISSIQSNAQAGEIDKYKAAILTTIQSNWRIPEINRNLKCVYSVSIAPDGAVLSVQLVKSSGSDDLDESARQAINTASPLPVPTDPAAFAHFRHLVLTLSPQGYLQSIGGT